MNKIALVHPTEAREPSDLVPLVAPCRKMLLSVLDYIIDRFDPDYGYIDTKIDIFTGEDVAPSPGPTDLFGRDTVYAWIQSRGVEALCGHEAWIRNGSFVPDSSKRKRSRAISAIVSSAMAKIEPVRIANGGSLFFWFDRSGMPFTLDINGLRRPLPPRPGAVYSSNEFHVKAMLAAASLLGDKTLERSAAAVFREWVSALKAGTVIGDQQPFDPKNPVTSIPGRIGHGMHMITLGAFALYASLLPAREYVDGGFQCIRHILDGHVNTDGRFPDLDPLDFVEFIDAGGKPFVHDGAVLCDPGHALEFVGFSFKFIETVRNRRDLTEDERALIDRCDDTLPRLLLHVYRKGRNRIGGICKAFDLASGKPYNADMPWWNLPETMRAAMYACNAASDPDIRSGCVRVVAETADAFFRLYVRPEVHMMAYQTLDSSGKPIRTVPATPDLDPGYHTGLSIIDFLAALETARHSN